MSEDYWNQKKKDHTFFRCPDGHLQHFTSETEETKLKRQLQEAEERAKRERSARIREEHTKNQTLGKLRALKVRVKAGVCPCCHRTIKQLAAHMATKHPEYQKTGARP